MQAQVAWMLLLCFTCGGLCTDVNQDQRALEEELLSSLFTSKEPAFIVARVFTTSEETLSLLTLINDLSKMKQNKQSAPYWRVSLANLCRMVSSLRQEAWSSEEEEQGSELREGGLQLLEELYNLQLICRALQSREERLLHDSQEYLEENGDTPLKRKSPYILKRQASHTTKSRRPYILKRSTIY